MNALSAGGMSSLDPVEVIGRVHMMPTGSTHYFTAKLKPGRYPFISEETADQGVLHEVVPAEYTGVTRRLMIFYTRRGSAGPLRGHRGVV